MPLSKLRNRERMRELRQTKGKQVMSKADVRAIRRAGLSPEYFESEATKVSSSLFYALLRDRDAIKAHLSWHHDMLGKPDVGTMIEQLQARVTLLEANFTLHEAREAYDYPQIVDKGSKD